jgi:hypothetical protein
MNHQGKMHQSRDSFALNPGQPASSQNSYGITGGSVQDMKDSPMISEDSYPGSNSISGFH